VFKSVEYIRDIGFIDLEFVDFTELLKVVRPKSVLAIVGSVKFYGLDRSFDRRGDFFKVLV
jgi:hypothetical protein